MAGRKLVDKMTEKEKVAFVRQKIFKTLRKEATKEEKQILRQTENNLGKKRLSEQIRTLQTFIMILSPLINFSSHPNH